MFCYKGAPALNGFCTFVLNTGIPAPALVSGIDYSLIIRYSTEALRCAVSLIDYLLLIIDKMPECAP